MKALYAYEQGGGERDHVVNTILRPPFTDDPDVRAFALRLFRKATDAVRVTDEVIGRHAENWDLGRIALIDRLVLRMAVTELLYFEDIPPKVSLNEAIEVARKYSTDRSTSFINGVLDAALSDLKSAGRLKKTGRGLVGMNPLHEEPSE